MFAIYCQMVLDSTNNSQRDKGELMNASEGHRCSYYDSYTYSVSLKLFQNNELKTKGMISIHVKGLIVNTYVDFVPVYSVI